MREKSKTTKALVREIEGLRLRLDEAEQVLHGIQAGEVDALVVSEPAGEKVYTLEGAEHPYRVLVEAMNEGALTLTPDATIFYCNTRFAEMVKAPLEKITSGSLDRFVAQADRQKLSRIIEESCEERRTAEFNLKAVDGTVVPSHFSFVPLRLYDKQNVCVVVTDLTKVIASRETRLHLAAIVESSDDAIISTTAHRIILSWNAGAERLFGYSAAEATGQSIAILVPPDRSREIALVEKRIKRIKVAEHLETVRVRKDGKRIDVSLSISPVKDPIGRIVGTSSIFCDITERKRAEEELRRLNRALRTISECNEAVVRAREESELLQEICRILVQEGGYRLAWVGFAEQDEAKTVRPAAYAGVEEGYLETLKITWADTERGRGPTGTAIRTGQPSVCRNMLEDPNFAPWREEAVRRGYASSISLPLALDGQPAGALTLYSQTADAFDTEETQLLIELADNLAYGIQTLRTRAERVRSQEALRRANAYNRSLIEASLDPLVTISPQGKITDVNRATERVTGSSRGELIGTDVSDYFTDPEKARAGYQQVFRAGWVQDYELEVQHRDGHVTPVVYNASVYRDEAGQEIGVFAAARDITERKRMEEELRQLSGHLLEAQDEERRRIARELHDSTSQNLAAIALNLGLIKESDSTDEERRKCLEESISLTELSLNEIRNLSYLLHPPLLDEMGLSSALEYYVDGFSRRSGISVALEISPELGRLPKDAERTLFRVVQESLTNMLRHAGSSTARIAIARNPEGVVLEVADRGHGILTSSADKPGGTPARSGVGIPGMRERVRLLGGRLEIDSGAQGTTVRATLPFPESGS